MSGIQQAKIWCPCSESGVTSSWRRWRWKQVKSPVHLCSLKKMLSCVGFRTVLVFILWRSVEHCECWTCAWLLSLIFVVLILLTNALQNHQVPCLQSEQTHLTRWWISFTVYNNTSWRQNVTDIFDILYEYWIFSFLWNLYIYSSVCLLCIFWLRSSVLAKMGSHVLYCHLLALVFRTGISAVIVSPWRSHCNLSPPALFVYWPHLPCSVPIFSLSLSL